MNVIGDQPASRANRAPGDRVFRISFHRDDPAVFHLEKKAASGMAQAAIRSSHLSHDKILPYLAKLPSV
jgi:hypothetical protein